MTNLNEIYKSVLEADKAAVVICDPGHMIIYMNPAAISRYEKWGGKDLMGNNEDVQYGLRGCQYDRHYYRCIPCRQNCVGTEDA